MKVPLTEQQKIEKKQKEVVIKLTNSIKQQFSFGKVKTWNDVYKFTFVPPNTPQEQLIKPISFPELKSYLESYINNTVPKAEIQQPLIPSKHELDTLSIQADKAVQIASTKETENPVEDLSSTNDYGFVSSPNEKYSAYWFQKKAIVEAINAIVQAKKKAILLLSGTGTGKTFMVGGITRRLVDSHFHDGKTFGVVNYLYVTRVSIVEQTRRVIQNVFNLKVSDGIEVINIEQLRVRAGKLWVNETSIIQNGEEVIQWKWKKHMNPVVVIWDECQALKNSGSTQHKIASALNELEDIVQIFVSASPFTRVVEAKCFAVATHKDCTGTLGVGIHLSNENWPTYSSVIAGSQFDAEDYNEAAVERLIKDLEPYIVRVKGVRPQFDAINAVEMIRFQTPEEEKFYLDAWDRYLKEKAKLDAKKEAGDADAGINQLVAFLKFRMAAELCRADYLAKRMYETVNNDGKAACCALNFKGTIIKAVQILNEKYGVPRNKISLIWGGGQTQLTAKQKAKRKILDQADKLKEIGMSMEEIMETLDLDEIEDRELQDLPEHLKLGVQSKEERQREIDRYQSGKSDYCFFTFRAGGVGLSLHHSDELSPIKVRHQKNGYAVLEDIPKVPIKPRRLFAAPTYSAIELVQGLGRCPRLTSLSDTEQFLVFYTGTIEDDVAAIVSKKLRCLSKVVKMKEKWQDVVIDGKQAVSKHVQDIPDDTLEEQESINADTEDEE